MSQQFKNAILAALPINELIAVKPFLNLAPLQRGQVLQRANGRIENVWFLETGLASEFVGNAHAAGLEIAMTGSECLVGLPPNKLNISGAHKRLRAVRGECLVNSIN